MKTLLQRLKNSSLIWKLLISYILIISLPVFLLSVYLYQQSHENTRKEYEYIFANQKEQIRNSIKKTAEITKIYSKSISQNSLLRKYLQFYIDSPDYDFLMFSNLAPYLNSISALNPSIQSIHIYAANPLIPRYQDVIFDLKAAEHEKWLEKCRDIGYDDVYWEPPHPERHRNIDGYIEEESGTELLSLYTKIYSFDSPAPLGYLEVNIQSKDIYDFIHAQTDSDIRVLLADKDWKPVFQTNNAKDISINFKALENTIKPEGFDVTAGGNRYLAFYAPVEELEMQLLLLYPYSKITASANNKVFIIGIMALLIILSVFFITYFVSNAIFKRMNQLVRNMKKVQEGQFDVQIKIDSMDEIGQINKAFNVMVAKINSLIDTVYRSRLAEKEATLSYLQAQMNPHFLFNSMEAIRMMAEIGKNFNVSEALYSLGKVLRAHVKLNSLIRLLEEIDIVRSYVHVQNIRCNHKIQLHVEIGRELENFKIPALIIEPIVENSIIHGFKYKADNCRVYISAAVYPESCKTVIEIADNGSGFSPDRIKEINEMFSGEKTPEELKLEGNGIGLHNINERIKLYYGREYGIKISCRQYDTETSGTGQEYNCVSVILPAEALLSCAP